MKEYTLRALCEQCGVTRRAVQWYEKHGLVKPCGKNKMSYLLYDEDAVKKVTEIKSLQDYGLTVREIRNYFESDPAEQKKMLLQKYDALKDQCARTIAVLNEIKLLIDMK